MTDKPSPDRSPAPGGAKRATNNLVALGSAAVVAVYGAGFLRTRAAASQFDDEPAPGRHAAKAAAPTKEAVASLTAALDADTALTRAVAAWAKKTGHAAHVPTNVAANRSRAASVPAPAVRVARANVPTQHAETTTSNRAATEPRVVAQAPVGSAQAVPDTPPTPKETAPTPKETPAPQEQHGLRDGVYTGYGTSRHGDIEASVEIRGGRIVDAKITQCLTRYSCSWIEALPKEVVDRQSAEVDYVSGATQSSNAFYYAIVEALNKATSA